MPRPRLSGVFVKRLFTLLRLLKVPQTAVCQRLRVAKPTVSAWATGTRSLPPRHHRRFFAFVTHTLDDALIQRQDYNAAMARILAAQGTEVPWEQFPPEEQEALRPVLGTKQDHIGIEMVVADALLRPKLPDPQYPSLEGQVMQLLDEWWRETQHVELYRELWDQCRLVGAYGVLDFETFWRRVSSSPRERVALQRAADMLVTRARRLDRMVVPLGAEPLLERRKAWQALAAHPRERTEPRNTRRP
jgi:hypothetical protein